MSLEGKDFDPDGISVDAEVVTVKMLPEDYEVTKSVSIKLIKEGNIDENGEYCYKADMYHLKWYRGKFDSFPILVNTLINNCRLQGYKISAFGTDTTLDGREILYTFLPLELGDIDAEEGILQYDPEYECEHQQIQNQIVPGEDVQLIAYLYPSSGLELEQRWMGHVWWGTTYLSGGSVTAVNGGYGSEDITYSVNIMGKVCDVVPSDFIEYAVGDWVFVTNLSVVGSNCEWVKDEQDNWINETGIPEDTVDGWIILPFKVSDYGA
jgi:hypothetical protein